MRESTIEKAVINGAKSKGWWCLKLYVLNHAGFPDRLCLASGQRIKFVEFKAPGKKARILQIYVIKKLKRLGFEVHVIDSIEEGKQLFS